MGQVAKRMRAPHLQSVLRVIGFIVLPFAGLFCLLCIAAGMLGASVMFGIAVLASIYLISGAPHLIRMADAFPKATSQYEGDQAFIQTGGVRWGRSFWFASGWASVPFAHLRVSQDALAVSVAALHKRHTFTVPRSAVRRLTWKRAPFSLGLQIEHNLAGCPPFLLFWVTNRDALVCGLRDFGYEMAMI